MAENSEKTAKKRGSGTPCVKGKSGNPGGRPKKDPKVLEMLKAAASDAVKLLVSTVNDDDSRLDLRIKCAEVILDRVYGKAGQPLTLEGKPKIEIVMTEDMKELAT